MYVSALTLISLKWHKKQRVNSFSSYSLEARVLRETIMSATTTAGIETVTITQLQSSQDLSGSITTDALNSILQQHQQQQQSLVMATPVSSVRIHSVGLDTVKLTC